jgi:hypothetical protein
MVSSPCCDLIVVRASNLPLLDDNFDFGWTHEVYVEIQIVWRYVKPIKMRANHKDHKKRKV